MAIDLSCNWRSGFIMNPQVKERVGYLVNFEGLDLSGYLKQDIEVFSPFNNSETAYGGITVDTSEQPYKATVAGVIDSYSFGGGVGDPICIGCYISSENANQLKAKQKSTLTTTKITKLQYWIFNYDPESKVWFESAYPKEPEELNGQLNAQGAEVVFHVSGEGTKLNPNHDLEVFHVYFEIIPAANATFYLNFAESASTSYVKGWGLKVGTTSEGAMG